VSSDNFIYVTGHYTVYIRGDDSHATSSIGDSCWYHISDQDVAVVSVSTVLRAEAYMLFYETEAGVQLPRFHLS
jgi:ubiquitin C-terminal hydrolase